MSSIYAAYMGNLRSYVSNLVSKYRGILGDERGSLSLEFAYSEPTYEAAMRAYNKALDLWQRVVMRYEMSNSHKIHRNPALEESGGSDELLHIIPYTTASGDVLFYNKIKGRVIAGLYKQPNGLYSYYGLASYLTKLGGKGKLDTIWKRVEDGQYFFDRKIH